jgi:phosphotransferase system  glucose/maltose/N-acetylglucosamine-specific IIC component
MSRADRNPRPSERGGRQYVVFRFVVIRRWNLRTPGRELENDTEATEATESPKAA